MLSIATTFKNKTYLSSSALEAANPDACDKLGAVKSSVKSLQFSVTAKECGFDLGDPVLSEAAKVRARAILLLS